MLTTSPSYLSTIFVRLALSDPMNRLNMAMNGPRSDRTMVRTFLRLIAILVVSLTAAQFVECARGCDCTVATSTSSVASRASADQDGCLCCSQCLGARELVVFLPDSLVESVAPPSPLEFPVAPSLTVYRPPRS